MRTEELHYHLPAELIAQQPTAVRDESRLLVLDRASGSVSDKRFSDITEYLRAGDCLVINNTKVLQARFYAQRKTGGKLEGLFLNEDEKNHWLVMLKGAGKVKVGESICLKKRDGKDFCSAQILEKLSNGRCKLKIETEADYKVVLERIGFAPLPPYIKRVGDIEQNRVDRQRYQTVYAERAGAVAAPTAGLHFTDELIAQLREKGVHFANVTLHVGAGTFKPVTTETLQEHEIHSERFEIDTDSADVINAAKQDGGRVVAIGTTSVRVLETIADKARVAAADGSTNLFIMPGYEFKIVDAMVTNFHLPRSTLLALVGAFAGLDKVLAAYRHAIENRYRFYSYGDAMLIV